MTSLLMIAEKEEIEVYEINLPGRLKGIYYNGAIAINERIETIAEKRCVLAEELGHHYTTTSNILDQNDPINKRQEIRARKWAYELLAPINRIFDAYYHGYDNVSLLAEYFNVTEEFIIDAINSYKNSNAYFYELRRCDW